MGGVGSEAAVVVAIINSPRLLVPLDWQVDPMYVIRILSVTGKGQEGIPIITIISSRSTGRDLI